jgi:hypothetical protein
LYFTSFNLIKYRRIKLLEIAHFIRQLVLFGSLPSRLAVVIGLRESDIPFVARNLTMSSADKRNVLRIGPPEPPGEAEITPTMVDAVRKIIKDAGGILTVWAVTY